MNTLLRVGIWYVAFVEFAFGVVATLVPRVFYDYFPWVHLVPPFSEHLVRDYGAMNLALGFVTVVAACTMDRRMVRTALTAYLLFAISHVLFHVTHHDSYTESQAGGRNHGTGRCGAASDAVAGADLVGPVTGYAHGSRPITTARSGRSFDCLVVVRSRPRFP